MSTTSHNNQMDSTDASNTATVRLDTSTDVGATTRIDTSSGDAGATARIDTSTGNADATTRIDVSSGNAGATARVTSTASTDATTRLDTSAPANVMGGDATVRIASAATADATVCIGTASAGDSTIRIGAGSHSSGDPADATIRLPQVDGDQAGNQSNALPVIVSQSDPDTSKQAAGAVSLSNQVLKKGQGLQLKGVDYKVMKVISDKGGEANTYLIENEAGEPFALKQYKNNAKAPQEVLKNILSYPHPNVIGLVDYGHEHGFDYELQNYFDKGNLEKYLEAKGAIKDILQLKALVSGVLNGLKHLHSKVDIIYQDLKPSNILVSGKGFKQVLLSDFGISTRRNGVAESEHIPVIANVTEEYAAPELARMANNHKTRVSNKVDYYALGVTLWECWCPDKPFKKLVSESSLRNLIEENRLPLPGDMDHELATLIRGLLNSKASDRFNYVEIERWLRGEPVVAPMSQIVYKRRQFIGNEFFQNKSELAALIERYPDKGADHFYTKMIEDWLKEAGDMDVLTSLVKIRENVGPKAEARAAGVKQVVYVLDPDRPLGGPNNKSYKFEDLGFLLLENYKYYLNELGKNSNDDFYSFLRAHDNDQYAQEIFVNFSSKAVDKVATLNGLINEFIGEFYDGKFYLEGKFFENPTQLASVDKKILLNELCSNHSRTLLWLKDKNVISESVSLQNLPAYDLVALCHQLPSIRPEEIQPNIRTKAEEILTGIAKNRSHVLLKIYEDLGLDFGFDEALFCAYYKNDFLLAQHMLKNGANPKAVSKNGDNLVQAAVYNRLPNWIELFVKAGADVNATTDKFKSSPLKMASSVNTSKKPDVDINVVKLLLDLGADPNLPSDNNVLPLHAALFYCNSEVLTDVVELLLQHDADIHKEGRKIGSKSEECNAIFSAVYALKNRFSDAAEKAALLACIERLIDSGADTRKMYQDRSLMHFAAEHSLIALVDLLIAKGIPLNQANQDKLLPVSFAALTGNAALEKKLLPGLSKNAAFKSHAMRYLGFLSIMPLVHIVASLNNDLGGQAGLIVAGLCLVFFRVFMSSDAEDLFDKMKSTSLKKKIIFGFAVLVGINGVSAVLVNSGAFGKFEMYSLPMMINFIIVMLITLRFALSPGLEVAAYRRYFMAKQKGAAWVIDCILAVLTFFALLKFF